MSSDADVAKALQELQVVLAARIRAEQLKDRLTGLPNDEALEVLLGELCSGSGPFWAAFVEVDRFKALNDRYGYKNADTMLIRIAETLVHAERFFPGSRAFRAHGDEFYIVGTGALDGDEIHENLTLTCRHVAGTRVPLQGGQEMNCTVSVGWVRHSDIVGERTARVVLAHLEQAVSEAKLRRNHVVRFSAQNRKDVVSVRGDCGNCGAKFSVDVERSKFRADEPARCPNCGANAQRQQPPVAAPTSPPNSVELDTSERPQPG
jgi:diguanylate cyclase (GGDEF)-like protein